jgi:hypothetical protein
MFRIRMISLTLAMFAIVSLAGCGQQGSRQANHVSPSKVSHESLAPHVQSDGDQGGATRLLEVPPCSVAGQRSHENLTVFLLTVDEQDHADYLTLDEGLKNGQVKISEMESGMAVDSLRIVNSSDRPLYLQEGERLYGGNQDRIITSSLVIPPKSGKTSVPAFCVEHDRSQAGKLGQSFGPTVNVALATKGMRAEAKIGHNQQGVWDCVSVTKTNAARVLGSKNATSSINELFDDTKVRELSQEYADALKDAVTGENAANVVGVVVVINNAIEEINIYPNHKVLERMYPRLVQSYALYAALLKDEAASDPSPTTETVRSLLYSADYGTTVGPKPVDGNNSLEIANVGENGFQCSTMYQGKLVHWQLMKKIGNEANGKGLSRKRLFGSEY